MSTVHDITTVDQFNELISSAGENTLVALNFHAPWAAPCAQMNQVFTTLASQAKSANAILFLAIDAEELPDISESYDVSAVPYFVLLKNNTILKKISGADPAELAKSIESLSGSATGFSLPPPQKAAAPPAPDDPEHGAANGAVEEEDLNARLMKLVNAAPVMLFMKGTPAQPQCGFSRTLVGMLRERGVRYGFFNILADDDVRQGLKTFSDWPTFPQLYVNGQLVGGLDIVKEEFENDPEYLKDVAVGGA